MYSPNNIRFRIVSSSAIARFRQDQAFDFNELINNEAYSFSAEARETLLLNYDLWFKFILRLEKVLIRNHQSTEKLGALVEHIEMFAHEVVTEIDDIVRSHPTIFDSHSKSSHAIRKAYGLYHEYLLKLLLGCRGDSMYVAFPKIVNAISNCLHNLLFILHEVENLKKGNAFLSYTLEVDELIDALGHCPLTYRAKLYHETFGIDQFVIKNYTSGEVNDFCIDWIYKEGCGVSRIEKLQNFEHPDVELPDTSKISK